MCGCAVENAILQWRIGPDDTNAMRTLHSRTNGCCVTDHNPQEGPSFRTGLHDSPLILVVWFTGVHGNNDISTNIAFKFPVRVATQRSRESRPQTTKGRNPSLSLVMCPARWADQGSGPGEREESGSVPGQPEGLFAQPRELQPGGISAHLPAPSRGRPSRSC